jgi:uncharacterized repeat protein (TIGR02543 family)
MKNTIKVFGIIAVVAVIGVYFTACPSNLDDNGNGGGGVLTYTVTYNAMGATGAPPEKETVTAGSTIYLHNGSGFDRTGYILEGWYTTIAGTTSQYDAGSQYTVTDNVTFYAKWVYARTVTFNINGGDGATPESLIVGSGSKIILPSISRSGFTFGGWSASLSGGTQYNAGSSFTVTSNITMNAIWYLSGVFSRTETALGGTLVKWTYTFGNGTCSFASYLGGTLMASDSNSYYIEENKIISRGYSDFVIVSSSTLPIGGEYYYK